MTGGSFKTYKFQDPQLDTTPGNKLAITLNNKEGQDLLMGLGIDSKFNGHGKDLGNFNHGTQGQRQGTPDHPARGQGLQQQRRTKPLEWSKISTFTVTLTDAETKQRIQLATPEGARILKRIELVK